MSLYDEAILIQKPSGYKAEKLYNVMPSPEVTEQSSVEFDGVDDYLNCGNSSDLSFASTNPFSVSVWAYFDSIINKTIISKGGASTSDYEYRLFTDSSGILFFSVYNPTASAYIGRKYTIGVSTGKWYHIVGKYNGGTGASALELYINGVAVSDADYGTGTFTGMTDNSADVIIGHYSTGYFSGSISDFAVFSRELNQSDVTEIYNYGSPNDLLLPASYGTDISQSSTKSVEFDGVDDYLNAGGDEIFNYGTGEFTTVVWVNFASISANQHIIGRIVDGNNAEYVEWHQPSASLRYGLYSDYSTNGYRFFKSTTWTPTLNNWYHIAIVNGNSISLSKIYINGVEQTLGSNTVNVYDYSLSADFCIGKLSGNYFEGSIDNVGIYDKALTQAEVTRQYNGGQPIDLSTDATSDSLVAYYQMGDGTLDDYPLIADQTDATLGSELVINGDFSNGLTGWNAPTQDGAYQQDTGSGMKMYSGSAVGASNALSTSGTLNIAGIEGKTYQLDITASDFIGMTNCTIRLNGAYDANNIISFVDGTQTIYFVAYTNFTYIKFVAASFEDGVTVNSISIKQVQGNPATMTNMSSSDITTDVALSVVNDLDLYYQMGDGILDEYPLIADQTNATLGSELVTNGDFATNITGWSTKSCTIVWDSGKLKVDNSSGNQTGGAYQNIGLVTGKVYKMTATMQLLTGSGNGTFTLITSTASGTGQSTVYTGSTLIVGGAAVTETFTFTPESADVSIQLAVDKSNATYTIDNISVKEVQGNPAMMTNMSSADIVAWTPNIETDFDVARSSTTTRINASGYIEQVAPNVPRLNYDSGDSCPYLLTEAASTNLITYPKSFGNSYWTKSGATIEGDASTAGSEMVTNGSFTTDSDWTKVNNATISGGIATISGDSGVADLRQDSIIPADTVSKIQFTVVSSTITSSTGLQLMSTYGVGDISTDSDGNYLKDVGTHTVMGTSSTLDAIFFRVADGAGAVTIDNVSLKEVQGFEAPKEIPVANGEELVENGDMESGGVVNVSLPDNWSLYNTPTSAYKSTGKVYDGTYSIYVDGVNDSGVLTDAISWVEGKTYLIEAYVWLVDEEVRMMRTNPSIIDFQVISTTTGQWTKLSTYATAASSGSASVRFMASGTAPTFYIDNVSVKEVTSYSGGGFETEAYKLVEDTSNGIHRIYSPNITLSVDTLYSSSVYAKKGERSWFSIHINDSVAGKDVWFDLDNGEVGTEDLGINGIIEPMANDWYRCSVTWEDATITANRSYIYLADADNSDSYQGDGTSGIYIAYAQFEESNYASSLMLPVTEGSTTSRVADAVTNAGNQSLFSGVNSSGTLYAEIAANSNDLTERRVALTDGTVTNRVDIQYNTNSNSVSCRLSGSVVTINEVFALTDITVFNKIAVRWSATDVNVYINGVSVFSNSDDYSFTGVIFDGLSLSSDYANSKYFYGKTKQVAVFDYLSDDQMVKLTEEGYNTFNALATANNFIIR